MCWANCLCDEIGCMREIRFFFIMYAFQTMCKDEKWCMHAHIYCTHPVQMDKKNVGVQVRGPYSDETTSHILLLIKRGSARKRTTSTNQGPGLPLAPFFSHCRPRLRPRPHSGSLVVSVRVILEFHMSSVVKPRLYSRRR